MATDPPERFNVSIPEDEDIDLDEIDELVRESEYGSRSEFVRQAILDARDQDHVEDAGRDS